MGVVDIVVFVMVAALILLRLRAELGNRPGSEPGPPASSRSVHAAPADQAYPAGPVVEGESDVIDLEADPAVRQGLGAIRRADASFDSTLFQNGAKEAYGMILTAFWTGDRDTLKDFVAADVLSQFVAAIDAREAAGETLDNRLLDIDETSIVAARLDGVEASITVDFKADLVAVRRDKDGQVIEGNLSDSVQAHDHWTFQRTVKSKDPRWLLVATQSL